MEQENKSTGMYWLIAIVITGIIVFLIFKNMSTSSELATAEMAITSLEQAKSKSDSLYKTFKSQLDIYKSENDNLYQQIAGKEEELKLQYDKINRTIQQSKRDEGSKKELEARLQELSRQIEEFKQFIDKQSAELEALKKKNAQLIAKNTELTDSLQQQINQNNMIIDENQDLKNSNSDLNQKVELASVLKVARVEAQAVKNTAKGDDKGINYAKRTEKLKVCFDVIANEVAPQAADAFFLRIIDPAGAPLVIESEGSGKMRENRYGKEIYYTCKKAITYSPDLKFVCMDWLVEGTGTTLFPGTYNFEVYNKGYLVGNTTLVLK